jgi:hypothetical protein
MDGTVKSTLFRGQEVQGGIDGIQHYHQVLLGCTIHHHYFHRRLSQHDYGSIGIVRGYAHNSEAHQAPSPPTSKSHISTSLGSGSFPRTIGPPDSAATAHCSLSPAQFHLEALAFSTTPILAFITDPRPSCSWYQLCSFTGDCRSAHRWYACKTQQQLKFCPEGRGRPI